MGKTSRFAAFGVFVLLSFWGVNAFACKCERSIDPVKGSVMVFWGKVTEIKPRGAQDRVKFDVSTLYKGDEEKSSILVYTNRFNHDCGFRFEEDKTYMVYAYDFYPRGVATSACWGTHAAEEAVPEDKWRDVKVKEPEDTKLEQDLRKVASKFVPNCGAKNRVFDGGFDMVLSPDGDPARPDSIGQRASDKLDGFRSCVGDAFLLDDKLPRPQKPVQIRGWYQRDVRQLPVLLDELPCDEGCEDWVARVKNVLMDHDGPDTTDQASVNLKNELGECLKGGISAVGGESQGAESQKRKRNRMLAECAMQRGDFDQIDPYLDHIGNETLLAAIRWAQGRAGAKPEGEATYPLRTAEMTFAAKAIDGKPTAGKFRRLRSGFFGDPLWAMSPAYLEAFAESVLADDDASRAMKDLAALAYERAGLLLPAASAAYKKLADGASSTGSAGEMRAALVAAHAAANAPPVEEVAPEEAVVEDEEVAPEVAEAPQQEQDPMLLVVAGVLIVVAVAGIGTILKRRR